MFHQRENRWVFFLPSLPLLRLRVRNPCQPWVCSWWCDWGDRGERGWARLLGPRGGGASLSPCLRPTLSPGLAGTWHEPLPLMFTFSYHHLEFSSPYISSLIHWPFPPRQGHALSLRPWRVTHISGSHVWRHGLTPPHDPVHHTLTLFMHPPSAPKWEHTERRGGLFHLFHSFIHAPSMKA